MTAESIQFFMRKATPRCKNAWKSVSHCVVAAKRMGITWPKWCLAPERIWYDVSERLIIDHVDRSRTLTESILFYPLGMWRLSKGVYRFSDELKSAIMSTKLPDDIPTDVLKRLPEWCVYIEMDGMIESDEHSDTLGAWAALCHNLKSGTDSLIIVTENGDNLRRFRCPLSESSISGMVDACMAKQGRGLGPLLSGPSKEHRKLAELHVKSMGSKASQTELLTKVINALLYICSSEPDIEDREEPDAKPKRARMQRMGKRDMFVAADRVRIWNVGDKVGEMIRNYNEDPADRKHTRRHLRRAHWHGYWTGKRGSDEREFSYKWLSPMVVGVSA